MRTTCQSALSAAVLFTVGYFFCTVCIAGGYSGFEYALSGTAYVFLLFSPIAVFVSGKDGGYISSLLRALSPYAPSLILSLICPLIISGFCKVSYPAAYTAILGTYLHTAAAISVFTLIDFAVESRALSLVLSFAASLFIYLQSSVCELLKTDGLFTYLIISAVLLLVCVRVWREGAHRHAAALAVLSQLFLIIALFFDIPTAEMYSSLTPLLNSILDFGSVLFLLLIIITCYLSFLFLRFLRAKEGKRASLIAAFTLAAFIFGNIAIDSLGEHLAVDASGKQLFTFSEKSREYIGSVEDDITVYELHEGKENVIIEGLLCELSSHSDKIKVERVNTLERPAFAKQYTNEELLPHSLIITNGSRHATVPFNEIISGEENEIYNGESLVLSAIFTVENEGASVYLYGNALDTEYAEHLARLGFTVTLADDDTEYGSSDAVIINTDIDISEKTKNALIEYAEGGGSLLLISEAYNEESPYPNLTALSERLGIFCASGTVLDDNSCLIYPSYLLPTLSEHKITSELKDGEIVMPTGQSLSPSREDIAYTPLLFTGDSGYLYFEDSNSDEGFYTTEYQRLTVAAIAEDDSGMRLVRYTSPYIFSGDFDMSGENFTLLLSTLSYLCDLPMPPATYAVSLSLDALVISEGVASVLNVLLLCVIPSIPLAFIPFARKKARNLHKVV